MKAIKQLLRQPVKMLSGILSVSLAVAILCVCVGQAIAAERTQKAMDYQFTTVALLTTKYQYVDKVTSIEGVGDIHFTDFLEELPEEIVNFIDSTVMDHPELVKTMTNPGLASAYIPELMPDNISHHIYHNPSIGSTETLSIHNMQSAPTYAGAIFEIVITEIGEPQCFPIDGVTEDGTEMSMITNAFVDVSGTIERVLSLEEGYDDPTGRTVHLSLTLLKSSDAEALEVLDALDLEVGGSYLVYGSNYKDGDWMLKSLIAYYMNTRGFL